MASNQVGADSAQSNIIQFPLCRAAPDPRAAFVRACIMTEIARAEYELSDRLCLLANLDGDEAAIEAARADHWRAFDKLVEATDALAFVPAPNPRFLDRKRRAIGKIWLGAEGDRYDRLRAGVAADEARLGSAAKRSRVGI